MTNIERVRGVILERLGAIEPPAYLTRPRLVDTDRPTATVKAGELPALLLNDVAEQVEPVTTGGRQIMVRVIWEIDCARAMNDGPLSDLVNDVKAALWGGQDANLGGIVSACAYLGWTKAPRREGVDHRAGNLELHTEWREPLGDPYKSYR